MMNKSTKNLEDDHVHILKLTEVMKNMTQQDVPDSDDIENVVELIRNFADGLHHAKEENIFFPALGEKGFSTQQGPVAVMLSEHVQGRNFVKGIVTNLEAYKNGNKDAVTGINQNMLGYANLLNNHILKENNILFRMADNALSDAEQKELLEKFETVEQSLPEGKRTIDYINRINILSTTYKIETY
jgi:hemerythrin-like domain-containing protein